MSVSTSDNNKQESKSKTNPEIKARDEQLVKDSRVERAYLQDKYQRLMDRGGRQIMNIDMKTATLHQLVQAIALTSNELQQLEFGEAWNQKLQLYDKIVSLIAESDN